MATRMAETEYVLKILGFLLPRLIWLLILPSAQHANIRGQWYSIAPGEDQEADVRMIIPGLLHQKGDLFSL